MCPIGSSSVGQVGHNKGSLVQAFPNCSNKARLVQVWSEFVSKIGLGFLGFSGFASKGQVFPYWCKFGEVGLLTTGLAI